MYILTTATILSLSSKALAWGALGHETVAYIAQNFVAEETKAFCQETLGDNTDRYLVDIATWADSYRREKGLASKRETQPAPLMPYRWRIQRSIPLHRC